MSAAALLAPTSAKLLSEDMALHHLYCVFPVAELLAAKHCGMSLDTPLTIYFWYSNTHQKGKPPHIYGK
jgi:hypothetical protein